MADRTNHDEIQLKGWGFEIIVSGRMAVTAMISVFAIALLLIAGTMTNSEQTNKLTSIILKQDARSGQQQR